MRHEPIEFRLSDSPRRDRESRRAKRFVRQTADRAQADGNTPAEEVVDEAFAGFAASRPRAIEPGLVASLSAQLDALDRQRAQLAQLLRNIDIDSISS